MKEDRLTNRRIEIVTHKAVKAALAVIDARAGMAQISPRTPLGDRLEEDLTRLITAALQAEAKEEKRLRKHT